MSKHSQKRKNVQIECQCSKYNASPGSKLISAGEKIPIYSCQNQQKQVDYKRNVHSQYIFNIFTNDQSLLGGTCSLIYADNVCDTPILQSNRMH